MIDFRIDTFITVCKYMNFTKAASDLNITQPAVSQHIQYLERAYNTKLFLQSGKKISLTESGKVLLDAAVTMKHDEQHLRNIIESEKDRKKSLKFGVTLSVGEFFIPYQIASYIKQNSPMSVRLFVSNTKELLQELNDGKIDFAIVEGYFPKNEYDYELYRTEPFIAVCAKDHVFAKPPTVIEDLLSETILIREQGSGNLEILKRSLEGKNLSLEDFASIMEINDIKMIKALTEKDCGITFLYEATVKQELEEGILKKIPLENFSITHDIMFIWRKNSIFSQYYRQLYHEIVI